MKPWKIATISIVALAAAALTVGSVLAFCGWVFRPADTYGPLYAPTVPTTKTNQTLPPVTQTNTQTPTLYTPNIQITTPGYPGYGYGGMGGCMGGRWGYGATYPSTLTSIPLTIDQAAQIAKTYVTSLNNPDLTVTQVEEYTANFYVQVNEVSTGYGAFQLLINKATGVVTPEMGPNMMWNTKYTFGAGYCNWLRGTTTATPTVTLDQAKANTQQYLNAYLPGTTVGDVTTFYGYYNVEILNAGTTYGMLSVNAYTGQVWYHTWHGTFTQELQVS